MKKLDIYLANLAVGNIKLHNLHWNVIGFDFKKVHEYIEELYDNAFEYFDEVAELQKQMGEFPKASMKEYMDITTLEKLESKEYRGKEAIELSLDYTKEMRNLAAEIREEADEDDLFPVANMMEDHIEAYDLQIWFMESMLK